ncbi:DUF4215 domain-containing protein [Sorangium sp. So ce542]|uniref:DUF4215 domain-containing protein n=1 Tax=Sorangium sp. So ce542 TaxID=3133316 RepID=UPI003F60886C
MRTVAISVLGAAGICLIAPLARAAPEPICTTIQRGLSGVVSDTYIRQASPNYVSGSDGYTRTGFRDGYESRALYRFELGFIPPDATILTATFATTVYSSGTQPISAHRVTAPWTELDATWSALSTSFASEVEDAFLGMDYGFASIDLTPLVQSWVNGSQPNYGFLLAEQAPNRTNYRSSEHSDPDSRPTLEICYVVQQQACGDGIVAGSETCDDGNGLAGDGCGPACLVESGYACTGSPSACSTACGDGVAAGPETCDDGNGLAGDGCGPACLVESGYACTGSPSACSTACGDGIVAGSETCDDGNGLAGDGCGPACLVESGYACTGSPSACSTACGDGVVAGSETCDDGNGLAGDGCGPACLVESGYACTGSPSACSTACGDGVVAGSETCDDGNGLAGDGCGPACLVESGYACTGSPSACSTACGDGIVAGSETCDDGNGLAGDGCGPACLVESGYACTGSPSACSTACGDGIVAGSETCDDGNGLAGDGCGPACLVESGYACTGSPSACACADGAPCDDGNACTQTDTCAAGACSGSNPVACAPPGSCEVGGSCDPASGGCVYMPRPDGTPCPGNGTCKDGACDPASLVVEVFDMSGLPVVGAKVVYGEQELLTDEDGAVRLDAIEDARVVAQVTAAGYAPVSVVEELSAGADRTASVNLLPLSAPIPVRTDEVAEVLTDDVGITIQPDSLVDPYGDPVSGIVGVTVVPLDPATDEIAGMPGPLEGITEDDQQFDLASLFMAEVTFWQGDTPLQLAPGETARLEFVLPDALQDKLNPGDTIDAWWFDMEAGAWRREGAGTIQASTIQLGKLAWVAEVSHFTWWNVDYAIDGRTYNCVNVTVVDETNGHQPVENATVRSAGVNYDSYSFGQLIGSAVDQDVTGSTGSAAGSACVNTMLGGTSRISVVKPGYAISGYQFGAASGYTPVPPELAQLPTVTTNGSPSSCLGTAACVELEVRLTPLTCVSGRVVDDPPGPGMPPEGVSGANVYAIYKDDLGPKSSRAVTTEDGNYCVTVPYLSSTRLQVVQELETPGVYHTAELNEFQVTSTGKMCLLNPTGSGCHGVPDIDPQAGSGGTEWSEGFGLQGSQFATDVVIDRNTGEIYVTGYFDGRIDFGRGQMHSTANPDMSTDKDVFLAKFRPNGEGVLWSKSFHGLNTQQATALALDSNGDVIVVGFFQNTIDIEGNRHNSAALYDGFVTKFSADGVYQWSTAFGGAGNQRPQDVAVDTSNPGDSIFHDNIAVVGYFDNALGAVCGDCSVDPYGCQETCPPAVGEDIFVMRLFKGGNRLLGAKFGGPGHQRATAVTIDDSGDMLVTGEYEQDLPFGGGPPDPARGLDMFVAKLTDGGVPVWSGGYGETNGAVTDQRGVAIAASGSTVVVSGNFSGSMQLGADTIDSFENDVFVARFTSGGAADWALRSGTDNDPQKIADIAIDDAGNVILVGSAVSSVHFEVPRPRIGVEDLYIAKLSPQGSPIWSRRYGAPMASVFGPSVTASPGTIVVTASFGGAPISFGNDVLVPFETSGTRPDIALFKLYP